ncbi:MAG: putative metal-binding motif-containing protein [Alphaproteobacteria bacterium]|nr:putative metal-binding motif-containing protein [Alphaproteobacteria bacterium]
MVRSSLVLLLLPTLAACGDKDGDSGTTDGGARDSGSTSSPDDTGTGSDGTDTTGGDTGHTLAPVRFVDADGDGWGGAEAAPDALDAVDRDGDCDDTDPAVHPGATEACNGIDDDCDGELDPDELMVSAFVDADGDGHGAGGPIRACPDATGHAPDACDCDDGDPLASTDPLTCPAAACPDGGGAFLQPVCEAPRAVDLSAGLELTDDAVLTLCAGDHPFTLTVDADRVAVRGEGAPVDDTPGTTWRGTPALEIVRADAAVLLSDLYIGGASYSTSSVESRTGLLVDARAGGVELALQRVDLGASNATIHNISFVHLDGDLTLVDSTVRDLRASVGSSYSNSCTFRGVVVTGDLTATGSTLRDFSASCSGWSHSALAEQTATAIDIGGDAVLDDVTVSGHDLRAASSGNAAYTVGAVLSVGGDLTATDLSVVDNTLTSEMSCYDYWCYRGVTGATVQVDGSVDWSGGSLTGSVLSPVGTMYATGEWVDTVDTVPLRWWGTSEATLALSGVDLGDAHDPDVGGAVEADGSGVTDLSCTVDGCD